MPILCRRISIRRASEAASRSSSSNRMRPAVGSIRRDMQRTRVDLPEPESPMMTKISPVRIASEASRTAPISPAAASCSGPGLGCARRKRSGSGPNSFQTRSQASLTAAVIALRRPRLEEGSWRASCLACRNPSPSRSSIRLPAHRRPPSIDGRSSSDQVGDATPRLAKCSDTVRRARSTAGGRLMRVIASIRRSSRDAAQTSASARRRQVRDRRCPANSDRQPLGRLEPMRTAWRAATAALA